MPTELVTVSPVPDGSLVRLTGGTLNEGNASGLARVVSGLTPQGGWGNLYLDFSAVGLISSVVLGQLAVLDRKLRAAGDHLALTGLSPFLLDVFRACRLTEVLDIRSAPPQPES